MLKHLILTLALSCFAQETAAPGFIGPPKWRTGYFSEQSNFAMEGPVTSWNLIPVSKLGNLIPRPPGITDHIQVRVTNLDPVTVKVTICLTYFDGNDEVKIERTVSRNEVGATGTFLVADASKITGIEAHAEELGRLP